MAERKYFELRALRRAPRTKGGVLSSTCLVVEPERTGHCFVAFSERFVTWVGARLPRGVSAMDPAYLAVVAQGSKWEVYAVYVDRSASALLWTSKTKPEWLSKLRQEKRHDCNQNTASPPSATASLGDSGPASAPTSSEAGREAEKHGTNDGIACGRGGPDTPGSQP